MLINKRWRLLTNSLQTSVSAEKDCERNSSSYFGRICLWIISTLRWRHRNMIFLLGHTLLITFSIKLNMERFRSTASHHVTMQNFMLLSCTKMHQAFPMKNSPNHAPHLVFLLNHNHSNTHWSRNHAITVVASRISLDGWYKVESEYCIKKRAHLG